MTQHPILFQTDMVKAILDNRKSMTRRIIKTDSKFISWNPIVLNGHGGWCDEHGNPVKCPYGKVGDILWVREAIREKPNTEGMKSYCTYEADDTPVLVRWHGERALWNWKWKKLPGMFLPKDLCRLFLKITDIKVERVQEISEKDAIKEGCGRDLYVWPPDLKVCPRCGGTGTHLALGQNLGVTESDCSVCDTPLKRFELLWKRINGEESWNSNPWVWTIEFSKTEKP